MIGKETWKEYRKDISSKLALTAIYVFMLACSLLLNILSGLTMFITIPFIVLPFTFAYVATLGGMEYAKAAPIISFFMFYPVYYQRLFFGGFKAIIGFLKGVLISIIFSTILTIILYYTYLRIQPGFAEILSEIDAAKDVAAMQSAMEKFYNFEPANLTLKISTMTGSVFGAYTFIRHCLLNSEKFYLNLITKQPIPMKAASRIYAIAARARKKEFFKEYYGAVWYVGLWFFLTLAGGAVGAMFLFNIDATRSLFIGLFVSLILLFPFIPYYFGVMNNIFLASHDDYSKASITLSERTLEDLKRTNQLNAEQQKLLEEELQRGKEEYEKMLKELEEAEKKEPKDDKENKK